MDSMIQETIKAKVAHADAQLKMAQALIDARPEFKGFHSVEGHQQNVLRALVDAARLFAESVR